MASALFSLFLITSIVDGFLSGAGLDCVIKQLPARKVIGVAAYSKYFLASDLKNGRFWYIPLGISAYVLNVASAAAEYFEGSSTSTLALVSVAAASALVHALGTSQAAPAGLSVRKVKSDDQQALTKIFDKFARWTQVRGVSGALMFIAMLGALATVT